MGNQGEIEYRVGPIYIVFSNPSHSSDTKARAAMVGGAPLGGVAATASRLLHPLLLPRLARASRGALPTQRCARLRVIVFSNPSHSSDIRARAAMDGGAPLG
jgi:uncharacterized SAM-binding protein YcdF (DUF218 family)